MDTKFSTTSLAGVDKTTPKYLQMIVLAGTAIYLCSSLFRFPCTPFLLGGDQVYLWMHGLQLLQGEQVYRDFFQFTPPGTDVFYFALFRILGPRIAVTNLAVLLLGLILCWVCFRLASQLLGGRPAALASSLFITLIYGRLLNATHHWFSIALILLAVSLLGSRRTLARVVAAGLLIGVAAFFTQSHAQAATLAIVLFLTWERFAVQGSWRSLGIRVVLVLVGILTAMLLFYLPYLSGDGIRQLWDFRVGYVRTYMLFSVPPNLGLPAAPQWSNLLTIGPSIGVYGLVLAIYPPVLLHCRHSDSKDSLRLALLALMGITLLAEVLVSVNWLRLYAVSMPAVILLVWTANRAGRYRRHAFGILVGLIIISAIGQTASHQLQPVIRIELPGGVAASNPNLYPKLHWLAQHTKPGESFFQANWPGLYLPLRLRNPLFLDTLPTYEPTRAAYIERTLTELEQNPVRYILWNPRIDHSDRPRAWQDQLAIVSDYLRTRYRRVHVFRDLDEVWERR